MVTRSRKTEAEKMSNDGKKEDKKSPSVKSQSVQFGGKIATKSSLHIQHSVEKREIYSHFKIISSNQLFRIFFSKNVAFTEFLRKKV